MKQLTEKFWKQTKFLLLFILSALILFILLTKLVVKIPEVNNAELLGSIDTFEIVLEKQKECQEAVKKVHAEIAEMKFDIHQVQIKDEIEKEIFDIRSIYKDNNRNSKYLYGVLSADILRIYFDTKEEFSSMHNNKGIIKKNLDECRAQIN